MLQIREIRLCGPNVEDAVVKLGPGPNIIAGESDTGKSYILHCLDYIFGAEEFRKRNPKDEPYDELKVEFENTAGKYLTLVRSLSGGDLKAHHSRIDSISEGGVEIAYRRHGTSKAADITSILFPFAGIKEAVLRRNSGGNVQRLTIRTLLPIILVDEVSMIEEQSPVIGRRGFDETARKRMFSYMLSGKDDSSVVASEKKAIVSARLNAQVALIDDLLAPLEKQLRATTSNQTEDSIDVIDLKIAMIADELTEIEKERATLLEERDTAGALKTKAETQILAIDQLLTRYQLLSEHYQSDLSRLDFIAEGAHYFESLQTVTCPLCGQNLGDDNIHQVALSNPNVYSAAKAEAAKILAQKTDLEEAIRSLKQRRNAREADRENALTTYLSAELRLTKILQTATMNGTAQIRSLVVRRLELEAVRNTSDQVDTLRDLKVAISQSNTGDGRSKNQWESLPRVSLLAFCKEVETVLREWKWEGEGRVEFDEKNFDINVDGQTRQSHGKGFRAVLYSAFVIALVRYCQQKNLPHPGVVIIDSPLTSYKRSDAAAVKGSDLTVSSGVEEAFWESLTKLAEHVQIIVVENKEPPADVAALVNYEWFAGNEAGPDDRVGFIPEPRRN
jgi:hypothetical protein